jgi:hypothetical protein
MWTLKKRIELEFDAAETGMQKENGKFMTVPGVEPGIS